MHPTRIFKSADELLKAWNLYKKDLEKQKAQWIKTEYVGRNGDERKTKPVQVPMTLEGFKRFCREHKDYGEVEQYFSNQDGLYDDFIGICSRIREEIRENQIIGGLLGVYNPSITQRLNGLTDKVQHEGGDRPLFLNLDTSELEDDESE